jgi:uncharacterized protein involved in cysteine biosynthesis
MDTQHIVLDPLIRDWVLLPMTVVIVLVFLARTFLMQYLEAKKAMHGLEMQHRCVWVE